MLPSDACAARDSRSRNTFTSDTDTSPGETPGTRKEPGNRNRTRVAGPGGRPAGAGAARQTGQPGSVGRARPPPSHTWRGPCPIMPGWHPPYLPTTRQQIVAKRGHAAEVAPFDGQTSILACRIGALCCSCGPASSTSKNAVGSRSSTTAASRSSARLTRSTPGWRSQWSRPRMSSGRHASRCCGGGRSRLRRRGPVSRSWRRCG